MKWLSDLTKKKSISRRREFLPYGFSNQQSNTPEFPSSSFNIHLPNTRGSSHPVLIGGTGCFFGGTSCWHIQDYLFR